MSDPPATSRWGPAHRARERVLLAELAALPAGDPRRVPVRDELVTMHLPLVWHLAGRYRDRGEPWEDLVQVGTVGLIKAVDRFDMDRGVEFSTYATPTILGEIKRNFRDRSWALKVPRRLQELQSRVSAQAEILTAALGRAPTVRELAVAIDVPESDILDALEARHAYAADSLDASPPGDDPGRTVAASIGAEDPAILAVEDREVLRPLLAALPDRERSIVMLRFFERKTQSQIAEQLGISQMHVSRLLARTLAGLRAGLEPAR